MNESKQTGQVPPALEAQVPPTSREKLIRRLLILLLILLILGGGARFLVGNLSSETTPAMPPATSSGPFN